jgi:hypothetical protein
MSWKKPYTPTTDGKPLRIAFRTREQAVLFMCELSGQISDGNWENASPHDHWMPMCDAVIAVDPNSPSINFRPRRSYNFSDPELLEVVGDRIIWYVKCAKFFPKLTLSELEDVHWDLEYLRPTEITCLLKARIGRKGDHLVEKRMSLKMLTGAETEDALVNCSNQIANIPYDEKELRADLNEMKKLVNGARKRG